MYSASTSITINATADKVWQALTDPELIKQYLFGTTVVSDWQQGSPIVYKGEWSGKPYEDKGTILQMEPGKLLKTTYFSSLSGQEDKPENYQTITYTLEESNGQTLLTLTQGNVADQASADHAAENWKMILDGMKNLLER